MLINRAPLIGAGSLFVGLAFLVVLTGLSVGILPWYAALAPAVLVLFVWLAWRLPEYAMLILCAAQTGILPPQVFSHTMMILAFVGLNALVVFKHQREANIWWPLLRPYATPLGILLALVTVSAIRGLVFGGATQGNIAEEAIQLLFWMTFPLLVMSLKTRRRLNSFVVALVLLAFYVSIGQFIQAIFHQQVFFAGRIEDAETLGQTFSGVTRSVTPAIYFLILGLLIAAGWVVSKVRPVLAMVLLGTCFLGLLLTYGRTLVVGTALALIIVGILLGMRRAAKLAVMGAIIGTVVVVAVMFAKPRVYDALEDRLLSIKTEVIRGDSFSYRLIENQAAMARIAGAPILGIGIGQDYRQPYLAGYQGDFADVQARYIHNGYLYVLLKLGVAGLLAYVAFIAVFFARARRVLKATTQPYDRALVAASIALLLIPLFTAATRPEWMSASSTAVFAICMALVTVVHRLGMEQTATPAAVSPAGRKPRWTPGLLNSRGRAVR